MPCAITAHGIQVTVSVAPRRNRRSLSAGLIVNRKEADGFAANVDPRSNNRSSTFRSDSGNRTYISTTRRITSGDELKYRNELGGSAPDLRLIRRS